MWMCAFGCNFGWKIEKINLLKQQEQLDSRHAKATATLIYETTAHIKFKLYMHRKWRPVTFSRKKDVGGVLRGVGGRLFHRGS